jgi:hypothetical protein
LSDNFRIQNGVKQGDAFSPLLSNFALEYAIKKKNSVVLVRKRTILTDRPQPVGEGSANFS